MKIAVVSGYPSDFNSGMFSSDLALRSFLARHAIVADLTHFSIGPELSVPWSAAEEGCLTYRSLHHWRDLTGFDRILFWGDFLHSRRFHQQDIPWMARNLNMPLSPVEMQERVFSALVLENAPHDLLQKVVCFGGSIYIDTACDAADSRYMHGLSRLFTHARLVLMRDPISAARATLYGAVGPTQGVDCALLLQPFGSIDWRDKPVTPDEISFSFGRGPSKRKSMQRLMHQLVGRIGRHLAIDQQVPLDWLRGAVDDPMGDLVGKLQRIRQSALVITDTYHCAVNSWREGVPAICIGMGAEHATGTLSDKKKELFLNMFGGGDFYVFSEELRAWKGVRHVTERLSTVLAHWEPVTAGIRTATERAETVLANAITT